MYRPSPTRVPLILVCLYSFNVLMTAPAPPAQAHERARYKKKGIADIAKTPRLPVNVSLRLFCFGLGFAEVAYNIYALRSSGWDGGFIVPTDFFAGVLLMATGAYIRLLCYRAMGHHFTFDLSLRENHELITHGPYAVVRHPGYTGALFVGVGLILSQMGPSSFWTQMSLWESTGGRIAGSVYIATITFGTTVVFARVGKEDKVLRETFGNKWIDLNIALAPPTPSPQVHETAVYRKRRALDISNAPSAPVFHTYRFAILALNGLEVLHIATALWTDAAAETVQLRWSGVPADFLAGFLLLVSGSYIRATCYHTLGRHFTFHLSLQDGHELITHGPYAIVRHPSYAGHMLVAAGILLTQLGPSSYWTRMHFWGHTSGQIVGVVHILTTLFSVWVVLARVGKEDAVLRAVFKEKWDAWAERTPYKLVPLVY
ncbi:hypothetical protein NM688_g2505 [Phlebia brevispora]|uniref:Uncharacterized protein n=1 Tax=Phlebia brevispora TaxID=194682 RepID=A0ACC1T8N7_9APHY|nr:hypothetical protein NM688_g2505 [Phlebia brevispora]